jgi:hypothetical protein
MCELTTEDTKGMMYVSSKELIELLSDGNCDISDQLLLEKATFADLIKNVKNPKNFNTVKRQFSTQPLVVTEVMITPYLGTKSLLVRAYVNSDSGKQYKTVIMFTKVKFVDDVNDVDNPNDIVEFVASDGQEYAIEKINLKKIFVKIRCDCLDYRWRFSYYNSKKGSQYGGPPPPYQKKTNRPPVNPNKVEGCCKHIIKSLQALIEAGLVGNLTTQFK